MLVEIYNEITESYEVHYVPKNELYSSAYTEEISPEQEICPNS